MGSKPGVQALPRFVHPMIAMYAALWTIMSVSNRDRIRLAPLKCSNKDEMRTMSFRA